MAEQYFIGVDVGGTFTDLALMDGRGQVKSYKTATTPGDFKSGVLNALKLAAEDNGLSLEGLLERVRYFGHGTTIATNALIQRKGARTGLVTTKGFGDTIFVQRMMALAAGLTDEEARHYSRRQGPVPIIPRKLVREVTERVVYNGREVVPVNKDEARKAIRELAGEGVEALAICFLWSFMNPSHEQEVARMAAEEAPHIAVTTSNELLPAIGEYERTSATAINAYLAPIISAYMRELTATLQQAGLKSPVCIMNSMGGVTTAGEAARTSVALINSGPSGGVLGSIYLGKMLGLENIIATDMGGTSFDVSIIAGGKPSITTLVEVSKYHVSMPMIDIASIGAGGGSIASVVNGELKVGPQSAGSRPGPACYDAGGEFATVTDADLVLGIIDADYFLGGRIKLNREKAEQAIRENVARPLGIEVIEAAAGIKRIVDNQMADLLRAYTLQRGFDPRDFILLAYGGAGPTHCASYAAELNVKKIIVPSTATVHSAYGALAADMRLTFEMTDLMRTPAMAADPSQHLDLRRINTNFEVLEKKGAEALAKNGIAPGDMVFQRTVGMLYRRQSREIQVPAPSRPLQAGDMGKLVERFEKVYEDWYGKGTAYKEAGIELRRFRVDAIGRLPKPALKEYSLTCEAPVLLGTRPVYFYESSGFCDTPVYDGNRLMAGNAVGGPAILQYPGTTVVVNRGQKALIDSYLNCLIDLDSALV